MTLKSFVSLTTAAALALMMAAGCTLPGGSPSLSQTKVMDFDAPLTLKKPAEPIKESPEVLFLGNSFTFYNDLPQTFLELSYEGGFSDVYKRQPHDQLAAGDQRLFVCQRQFFVGVDGSQGGPQPDHTADSV